MSEERAMDMVATIEGPLRALLPDPNELAAIEVAPLPHYLLAVRAWRELDVVDGFRRRGFRAFWPHYTMLKPSRRVNNGLQSRGLQRVGIIPGSMFVQMRQSDHQSPLVYVDGLAGALGPIRGHGGDPLVIDDADVDIIRRIEMGLNTPTAPGDAAAKFRLGDRVRFLDDINHRWGAGVVVRVARRGRISVEVLAMGRKTEITVAPHQIERT